MEKGTEGGEAAEAGRTVVPLKNGSRPPQDQPANGQTPNGQTTIEVSIGMQVMLQSGGPPMTIIELGVPGERAGETVAPAVRQMPIARCNWFAADGIMHSAVLPLSALRLRN